MQALGEVAQGPADGWGCTCWGRAARGGCKGALPLAYASCGGAVCSLALL